MPGISDETRLKIFGDQLWAELLKIPTPAETAQFLSGSITIRRQIARECKYRAAPLAAMIQELENWKR